MKAFTFRKPCNTLIVLHFRTLSNVLNGPYNFISGKRVATLNSYVSATAVIEPATGEIICEVPCGDQRDVDYAANVAHQAFQSWKEVLPVERGRLLTLAGLKIRNNLEDIARLEVKNNGKPIWEARVDIESCASALEYFGGAITSFSGQHFPLDGSSFAFVSREPLGVVAAIGAWNFPMQTAVWKAAPALACGNTMIYKPSQLTPLTTILLAEIFSDAGIPPGVFNVVQGSGKTGEILCDHPLVSKLSFTGSVPTGKLVMRAAAKGIKNVTLELGGKSPLIIFEDADIVNAVKGALMSNFLTQGEVCSNGTRVFVHEKIIKQFIAKLVNATKKLKIGDPLDESVTIGATISREHAEKVLKYIGGAKHEGAIVEFGGERIFLEPPFNNGYYLSPCILSNCKDDMKVVKEEVFGAVMSILTFSTEEEVINRANASPFGLAGGVFTRDIQRAFRVVRKLEAGTVWVNTYNLYPPHLPFGGYKQSGIGRENGTAVFEHYTQLKTVYVETGEVDCGPLYNE